VRSRSSPTTSAAGGRRTTTSPRRSSRRWSSSPASGQHLRPRSRRQREPLGARPRLRAIDPARLQLGHRRSPADRDRLREDQRGRSPFHPRDPPIAPESNWSTATSSATAMAGRTTAMPSAPQRLARRPSGLRQPLGRVALLARSESRGTGTPPHSESWGNQGKDAGRSVLRTRPRTPPGAAPGLGTERVGFEPTRRVNPAHAISSRAP